MSTQLNLHRQAGELPKFIWTNPSEASLVKHAHFRKCDVSYMEAFHACESEQRKCGNQVASYMSCSKRGLKSTQG